MPAGAPRPRVLKALRRLGRGPHHLAAVLSDALHGDEAGDGCNTQIRPMTCPFSVAPDSHEPGWLASRDILAPSL